jgi:segregation and condensation protein B
MTMDSQKLQPAEPDAGSLVEATAPPSDTNDGADVAGEDNSCCEGTEQTAVAEDSSASEQTDTGNQGTNETLNDEGAPVLASFAELKSAIEALLFATTEPLSVARLAKILDMPQHHEVRAALLELMRDYDNAPHGIQVVEVAGGFQMATRPQYAAFIYRLKPSRRRNPLSQATLETLAIIAYKQPITRAEIEAIRGVDSTASIHTLLELGLIEVGGKREVPGRPQLFVTTQEFLKTFGLRSLADLPSIHELRRMYAQQQENQNNRLQTSKASAAEAGAAEEQPLAPQSSDETIETASPPHSEAAPTSESTLPPQDELDPPNVE